MQEKQRLVACYDPSDSDADSSENDESEEAIRTQIVESWRNRYDNGDFGDDWPSDVYGDDEPVADITKVDIRKVDIPTVIKLIRKYQGQHQIETTQIQNGIVANGDLSTNERLHQPSTPQPAPLQSQKASSQPQIVQSPLPQQRTGSPLPPYIMNMIQQTPPPVMGNSIQHPPLAPMVNIPFPNLPNVVSMRRPTNHPMQTMQYQQNMYAQPYLLQQPPISPFPNVRIQCGALQRDPRVANRNYRKERPTQPPPTNPNPIVRPNLTHVHRAETVTKRRPITLDAYKAKSLKKCDENDSTQLTSSQERNKPDEQLTIDPIDDTSNEPTFSPAVSDETAYSSSVPSPAGSAKVDHSPTAQSPAENDDCSQNHNGSETMDNVAAGKISTNEPLELLQNGEPSNEKNPTTNGYESDGSMNSGSTDEFIYERFMEEHNEIMSRQNTIETNLDVPEVKYEVEVKDEPIAEVENGIAVETEVKPNLTNEEKKEEKKKEKVLLDNKAVDIGTQSKCKVVLENIDHLILKYVTQKTPIEPFESEESGNSFQSSISANSPPKCYEEFSPIEISSDEESEATTEPVQSPKNLQDDTIFIVSDTDSD